MDKAAEHRAALGRVEGHVEQLNSQVRGEGEATRYQLDILSSRSNATYTSVMSLRKLGEQILVKVATFPLEIQASLQRMLRINWQMYQTLLTLQESLSRTPTALLECNIKFEDALGEYKELPYEFFRHWEV